MAILNVREMFSSQQSITGSTASTNTLDMGATGTPIRSSAPLVSDLGGDRIPFFFQVTEDFTNLTSLTVRVQQDTDSAFGSAEDVYSETFTLAELKAGVKSGVRTIPYNTTKRYMRVQYDVSGSSPSAGAVSAGIASVDNAWGTR